MGACWKKVSSKCGGIFKKTQELVKEIETVTDEIEDIFEYKPGAEVVSRKNTAEPYQNQKKINNIKVENENIKTQ